MSKQRVIESSVQAILRSALFGGSCKARRLFSAALAFLLTIAVVPVAAQTRFGSIAGIVTDESRAALPGVTVTLTSPVLQVPQIVKVTTG